MPMISIRVPDEDLAVIDAQAERAGMSRTALMVSRAKAPDAGEAARAVAALEAIQRQLLSLVDVTETVLDPPRARRRKRATQ
jgi:uncharacterized protein (DUF1778 family)